MMRALPAAWRQALPVTLLVTAALLWVYRDTVAAMVAIWSRSDTFAHAFLVPPIALWLIWRRRKVLGSVLPQPQPWMLVPIACLALVWLLGELVAMNALTQFSVVALLVLLVPAVLGIRVARELTFPLVFLFFAVPIGDFMLPYMMEWTADFTVWAVRASGVPVHREGLQFVIPSGNWSVVEACSGVRYLIASFMVGTLFAYLNYRTIWRRWVFVGVAILVPILANWLRAYMIVMIGHLSNNQLAVGVDHLIYGWVFFGVVIGLMFLIGARWAEPEDDDPTAPALAGVAGQAAQPRSSRWSATGWIIAGAVVAVVAVPHFTVRLIEQRESNAPPTLSMPAAPTGWQAMAASARFKPLWRNPAAEQEFSFRGNGREVDAYVAYYRNQDYGHKLVSSENRLLEPGDLQWAVVDTGTRTLDLDGRALTLRWSMLRGRPGAEAGSDPYRLVWQIYWVNGYWTSSDPMAKLVGALYRLAGRGDDGATVVLHMSGEDPRRMHGELATFASAFWPALEAALQQTRAVR